MTNVLTPVFVEFIPEILEDGTLYISREYQTAVHKCCCGCGQKVVTPLSPTGWRLTVDGGKVSLYPSIGNWSFPCRSHYWINRNAVQWSYQMSKEDIQAGRRRDARMKDQYFGAESDEALESAEAPARGEREKESLWTRFKRWLFG